MRKSVSKTVVCRGIHGERKRVSVEELSFRPSVYGIIIRDSKILLSRQWDGYDFPGGGIDLGETIDQALRREVKEETGVSVKIDRLLHCSDDFFIHPHNGRYFHSILLYYLCSSPRGKISTKNFDAQEKKYAKKAAWIELSDIDTLKFYNPVDSPMIVRTALNAKITA